MTTFYDQKNMQHRRYIKEYFCEPERTVSEYSIVQYIEMKLVLPRFTTASTYTGHSMNILSTECHQNSRMCISFKYWIDHLYICLSFFERLDMGNKTRAGVIKSRYLLYAVAGSIRLHVGITDGIKLMTIGNNSISGYL